jgi:selenocysteine-specific elongation factor
VSDASSTPPDTAAAGPHLTLGTAGHIDHGKTALITRLTGTNTDRLREERERGISIELGYAELQLPSGRRLSVVDVPGHERFVRTMVAGATGVDLVLLVVAADDGVMPQTVEHLRIVELLGVDRGVVAVTKADLVDEELLEVAVEEVREFLATTALARAPVVPVSARDGRGLDALVAALDREAGGLEARRAAGPARLPVDRVFALPGAGTIVTGTLWRGRLGAGDRVAVEPGGARAVVRSVEVHDHAAAVAEAGSRVGVSLRGVGRDDVVRGAWLVAPELAGRATRVFSAWVRLLPGERALRGGDELRLHHGTAQYVARVAPVGMRELAAGGEGPAVLRLDGEAAVEPQDRFILRSLSPVTTVGGGVVLVPGHQRWRERGAQAGFLEALYRGDRAAAAVLLARERAAAGISVADLVAVGVDEGEARGVLEALARDGDLETLAPSATAGPATPAGAGGAAAPAPGAGRWFLPAIVQQLRHDLAKAAAARAKQRPERPFSALAELAAAARGAPPDVVAAALDALVAEGVLVTADGGYGPAGATGVLDAAQEALAVRLAEAVGAEPFAPPTLALLAERERLAERDLRRVLDVLARRGALVRVDKDLWFACTAVDEARARLAERLEREGRVTLAEFRDLLGCGRRNAQALLEHFDREGLTRRVGDARVPRRRRGQ